MRDFDEVIVFLSIICPSNFTRVRKKVIYTGLLSSFRLVLSDKIFEDNEHFVFCLCFHKNIV